MKRTFKWLALSVVLMAFGASALAQSTTTGQATGQAQATAEAEAKAKAEMESKMKAEAQAQAQVAAEAEAKARAEAHEKTRAKLASIKEKGGKVSAASRSKAETKLQAASKKCDESARSMGDQKMAASLAAEYSTTAEALVAEKTATGASWGSLLVAYTLAANSNSDVTARHLLDLNAEGTAWSQIAAGLGLKLTDVATAVQTQTKVATGASQADGKVAVIHGQGARVGLDGSVTAGANTAGLDLGATTGVEAGVKIKP